MGSIWYVKKEDIENGMDSIQRFCNTYNVDIVVSEDPEVDWLPNADWKELEEVISQGEPILLVTQRDLGTENGRQKILFIR